MFSYRISFVAILLGLMFLGQIGATYAQSNAGTIICRITAFRASSGHIELSLYNREVNFPDQEVKFKCVRKDVKNTSVVEVRFENVPYGTYAVAGLHDENRSGGMDYNWLGIPKEGYCFSNDAKPFLSAPSFSDAKFKLDKPQKLVYITMQY